jgi:oligosaccharide 4-alpha-D-glucosyltransferase
MTRGSILFLLIFISISPVLHAQVDYVGKQRITLNGFTILIDHIDSNIYKIEVAKNSLPRSENASDAVILKHISSMSPYTWRVKIKGDSIFLRDRLIITSVKVNADDRGFFFPLAKDEKIFGGGERALPLNRRGYRLNLYNNPWYGYGDGADNLNYSVPFITSSKGYGLFFDNPSKGYLDIGKSNPDVLEYGASSGELNVYVIFGNYQQVLQSYHKLTGTQPLPPRWAFGNLMSRFGYTSEAQVKDILSKMHENNIPVDAVIFDLFWFGDSIKGTLGNLDWMNKTKWPDPKKMIADLKKQNIQTLLVTEPFFVETSKNYVASKPYLAVDSLNKPYYLTDFYFGKGGLIDIFRSDAQKWFWQFYKKQMNNGVEAWWGDLGEPEKHPSNMYHNLKDYGYKRLFAADEVHNLYGHTWTKMLYNYYAKEYPNKRLFSLNRSGFAGSQRYSIFPWTGDVSRSWSGLQSQLKVLLGMSMSGVPYVHSDAGGFAGGDGDNELYIRWLQFAAFTPILRPHGTALYDVEPAAKSFPSEAALIDTPYRDIAGQIIRSRYAMLSYSYSLAYQQAKYGKPLIAPVYYYYPADTTAANIYDQLFYGENVFVAPVLEKGAKTRKYYMPDGKWYNVTSNKIQEGNTWVTDSVTLEKFPLLIKEGSFLPTDNRNGNASSPNPTKLFMYYFQSKKSSAFELYEDDGISKNNLKTGNYVLTRFTASSETNKTTNITVSSTGAYNKSPQKKIYFTVPFGNNGPSSISVNGKKLNYSEGFPVLSEYSLREGTIVFSINYSYKPQSIKITWK